MMVHCFYSVVYRTNDRIILTLNQKRLLLDMGLIHLGTICS